MFFMQRLVESSRILQRQFGQLADARDTWNPNHRQDDPFLSLSAASQGFVRNAGTGDNQGSDSLRSLPSFTPELPNILKVLDIFHRICVPDSDANRCKSRRAPT